MRLDAPARSSLGGLIAASLLATTGPSLLAQVPAAPPAQVQPAAPAAAPQLPAPVPSGSPFVVTSDAAVFLFFVKPEREIEFLEVVAELKKGLAASTVDQRKAQAAGWKVFRSEQPPPPLPGAPPNTPPAVMYVFVVNPAVVGADYSPAMLLGDALGSAVGPIWLKYRDALAAPAAKATLTLLADFGK